MPGVDPGGAAAPIDRLVLDTSAYSQLRAGHPEVLDQIATATSVLIPTIVLGELEAAFRRGSRYKQNVIGLEEFIDEPFVAVIAVDREVSREYGKVFAALRARGTPIPLNDVWIAATTLVHRGCLLTFDRDFERVEGLRAVVLS